MADLENISKGTVVQGGGGTLGGRGETIDAIDLFVRGVDAIRIKLAELRVKLTTAVASFVTTPVRAVIAVGAILLAMTTLYALYEALKSDATFLIVTSFLKGLWQSILTIGAFFQVDTIITLVRLGDVFITGFHEELAKVYAALGSLSEELYRDVSFITVFTETTRALMHTATALSKNSWIEGEAAYAETMSTWLSTLKDKLNVYTRNPEQIFIDIQASIAKARTTLLDEKLGEIWAGIDFALDTAKKVGDETIKLLGALDAIKKGLPDEIQKAMDVWYKPFRAAYEAFLKDNWQPFWDKTNKALGIVNDLLIAHEMNIEDMQERMRTWRNLFGPMFDLPPTEKEEEMKTARKMLLEMMLDLSVSPARFGAKYREIVSSSLPPSSKPWLPPEYVPLVFEPVELPPYQSLDPNTSWYRGDY